MDGFASLHVFPHRIHAEMAVEALHAAGIPALVRAPASTGLFSIAHADPLLAAELFVPAESLEKARSVIAPFLEADGDEDSGS